MPAAIVASRRSSYPAACTTMKLNTTILVGQRRRSRTMDSMVTVGPAEDK
jgi:hypothetical protein